MSRDQPNASTRRPSNDADRYLKKSAFLEFLFIIFTYIEFNT